MFLKKNTQQLSGKKLYVDAFCGANEDTRLKVRFIMSGMASSFCKENMFIRPTDAELEHLANQIFVVMNGSKPVLTTMLPTD